MLRSLYIRGYIVGKNSFLAEVAYKILYQGVERNIG